MDSFSEYIDLSTYLARTFGVIYLAVGLGMFLYRESYIVLFRRLTENIDFVLMGGFVAVAGGMAMVSYHNIWVNDWRVIITIVGWIALIKGLMLLIMPGYIRTFRGVLLVRYGKYLTVAILLFGLALSYFGFF
ncbi:hypothetical protein AAOE16_16515 [Ekhidna sp. MALMAid0563]|uniref:hypothetical protein n=1 Tax=Ekhidna sp. MALMAid0563 TaxID=3143937 RepID=UPI0032DEB3B7